MRCHHRFLLIVGIFLAVSNFANALKKRPPPLPQDEDIIPTTPEAIAERDEQFTMMGKMMPLIRKFVITGEKAKYIVKAVQDAVNEQEFFLLACVAWGWFPLSRAVFNFFEQRRAIRALEEIENGGESNDMTVTEVRKFEESRYWYEQAKHVAQAAQIGSFVYAVDCLAVVLNTIGFRYKQQSGFSKKAAHISITVWFALRAGEFKRWFLRKLFEGDKYQVGKTQVYNTVLNVLITLLTVGHVLDLFDINVGVALASLLSIGGVGTLVLSLASKDIATELVSGLVVSASDRFVLGEEVAFSDGTAGFVHEMGLLYTDIRGYDERVTRIPNSKISSQKATNLSRVSAKSQVKQTLRFSYKDIKHMPDVVKAIKEEIRECCPSVIDDGSRPFRAHWRDFSESWLEVVVDAHFNTKSTGDAYYDLRQNVLEAIARAADRVGVEFTLPAAICESERLGRQLS